MNAWLDEASRKVAADATVLRTVFPAVGRRVGQAAADAARVELLKAAPGAAAEMPELYRYGDAAEKRAVLYGLSVVDIGDAGIELVADALRTNDPRLVTAAMGEYAATHLDAAAYRHGVLKCVFMGIPLDAVAGLDRRTDEELLRMLRDFAAERTAAGREVPADLRALLNEQEA
ncbi:EboA domain-containing protein [Streptomyces sp. MN03-5084-2B]|nr:EboA domain-containing protein [Streptomyces sp. MN03-5084-2B]